MKKKHPAWLMLIGCCFLMAGGSGTLSNSVGIFLRPIATDLNFGLGEVSLYMSIQGLAMAVALPFAGRILPKKNIRVVLSVAMLFCGGLFALMGSFSQLWQWYGTAVLLGIAMSFINVLPAPIIIGNWFKKKTGLAMGITMAFSGVGGAIMTPVGSYFITQFGWRAAYMIMGGIALLLVLPFTLFVLRFKPEDVGLKPYGADEMPAEQSAQKKAAAVTGIDAKVATRSAAFVCIFLLTGFITFNASYLQHLPGYAASLGMSATVGATLASFVMIGNIVSKLGVGMLNDKLGTKKTSVLGLSAVIVALVLIIICGGNLFIAQAGALLLGVNMAMSSVSVPLIVRESFGSKDYSAIFSTISVAQILFGAGGVTILGFLYDAFESYVPGFYVGIISGVISIVLLLVGLASAKKLSAQRTT